MQFFGLISLLLVVAIASWWLVTAGPVARPSTTLDTDTNAATGTSSQRAPAQSGYGEALEAARGAAGALER